MERLKMPEGEPIEHAIVTRSIESAQRKVEAHNFDIRKQLLEYDNVANDQRKTVYELRNQILDQESATDMVKSLRDGVVTDLFRAYIPPESVEEQWIPGAGDGLPRRPAHPARSGWEEPNLGEDRCSADPQRDGGVRATNPGAAGRGGYEAGCCSGVDQHWREHRRARPPAPGSTCWYAQNPKQEYQREAFELFERCSSVEASHCISPITEDAGAGARVEVEARPARRRTSASTRPGEALVGAGAGRAESRSRPCVPSSGRWARWANDPCPCGSGKKFKHR
jgi:preprotein translocase subunit SecA